MARARQRSWRCPWERLRPPSVIGEERERKGLVFLSLLLLMLLFEVRVAEEILEVGLEVGLDAEEAMRWTRRRASKSSLSSYSLAVSKFERRVPKNKVNGKIGQ